MVINLPANVGDSDSILGQEGALKKGMVTHSGVLAWEIPWAIAWRAIVHGVTKESDMTERLNNKKEL